MKTQLIFCAFLGMTAASSFSQAKWDNLVNDLNGYISYYDHLFLLETEHHHNSSLKAWNIAVPKFEQYESSLNESLRSFTNAFNSKGLAKNCGQFLVDSKDVENHLDALNECFHVIHENISFDALRNESVWSKDFRSDLRFLKSSAYHCSFLGDEKAERFCFKLIEGRLALSKRLFHHREPELEAQMSRIVHFDSTVVLNCGQSHLFDLLQVQKLRDTVAGMKSCLRENVSHFDESDFSSKWWKVENFVSELKKALSEISIEQVLLHH